MRRSTDIHTPLTLFVAVSIRVTEFDPTDTTASVLESASNRVHAQEAVLCRADSALPEQIAESDYTQQLFSAGSITETVFEV